jgi:hypothetical protein
MVKCLPSKVVRFQFFVTEILIYFPGYQYFPSLDIPIDRLYVIPFSYRPRHPFRHPVVSTRCSRLSEFDHCSHDAQECEFLDAQMLY